MTVQDNIDIVRRNIRRNVREAKLQAFALEIDNHWPILVPIAIPAHNRERRTDGFQIERNRRLTNVAQVPDLVRLARKIDNLRRQFVMSIRQNEYLHSTRVSHNGHNGHEDRYFNFRGDLCGFCVRSYSKHVI